MASQLDYTIAATVNGRTNCSVWAGLDAPLDAGMDYLLCLSVRMNMDANCNTYDSGDFGSAQAWYNTRSELDTATLQEHWASSGFQSGKAIQEMVFGTVVSSGSTPTIVSWTSKEIAVTPGIKSLLADWLVSQAPETGATITVEVKYGTDDWVTLDKATSAHLDSSPATVRFRFTIENDDLDTAVWVDCFGTIWELGTLS